MKSSQKSVKFSEITKQLNVPKEFHRKIKTLLEFPEISRNIWKYFLSACFYEIDETPWKFPETSGNLQYKISGNFRRFSKTWKLPTPS